MTSQFSKAVELIRAKPVWFEGEQVVLWKSDPYRFIIKRQGGYLRLLLMVGNQGVGNGFTVGVFTGISFEPYTLQTERQYQEWAVKAKHLAKAAREQRDRYLASVENALWVTEPTTRPPEPATADDILTSAKSDIQQVVDGLPPDILEEMETY